MESTLHQGHKGKDYRDLVFQHIFGFGKLIHIGNLDLEHILDRILWLYRVWESNQVGSDKLGFQMDSGYKLYQDHMEMDYKDSLALAVVCFYNKIKIDLCSDKGYSIKIWWYTYSDYVIPTMKKIKI